MAVQSLDFTNLSGQSLGADFDAPGVDVSQWDKYTIQINFTHDGTSAGDMKLQTSVDNAVYVDYPGSTQAVAAQTAIVWEVTSKGHRYVRVNWNNTAGTGSSCDVKYHVEKSSNE